MTINLTFNDFGEMKAAIVEMAKLITADKMAQEIVKEPVVKPMEAKEIPAKAEEIPAKAEEPKVDRVELRKILSVLNKTTGENTARKLINEMGFKALNNVPDDGLAELKAKAEEVLNA